MVVNFGYDYYIRGTKLKVTGNETVSWNFILFLYNVKVVKVNVVL